MSMLTKDRWRYAPATSLLKTTVLLPCSLLLAAAPERDWAAALRQDAKAFHATIAANHPGPVNRRDRGFATRNDEGLRQAIDRAAHVTSYPGYLNAMRGYAAKFDDGHLSFQPRERVPVSLRWPGFLTAYDEHGAQVVRARLNDAPVPLGAKLLACDGRSAEALAQEIVGNFQGRWFLASVRGQLGWRVFLDAGNPFVRLPMRCEFLINGAKRSVPLSWKPFSDAEFYEHGAPLTGPPRQPIGASTLSDGTRWFTLSGFDGDLDGKDAKALMPMIAAMKRDRAQLVAAPRIVLDLRGNGGGSSDWSRQIATILWGSSAADKVKLDSVAVEWRASPANVATLADYNARFGKSPDVSQARKHYFAGAAAGIAAANAAGRPLWREPAGLYQKEKVTSAAMQVVPPAAPIYVVTDWSCASACLDAVDLWKALGAVQIGQETSADTLYIDIRQDPLPSGLGAAGVPMKVYRGRPRGSNVPQRPSLMYSGAMRDTPSLQRWVLSLPKNAQR